MSTVEELLRAAKNADAAGDAESARALVDAAKSMMKPAAPMPGPAPAPGMAGYDGPIGESPAPRQADYFGNTIAAATEAPRAAMGAYAAGLADKTKSPSLKYLTEKSPNSPQWARDMAAALGDAGGLALSTVGTAYAGAAGLVGEMGGSPTNEAKLARDMMMMGQVAIPELAGVSSGSRLASRAARVEKAATPEQLSARAAQDLNITPSLGMTGKAGAMAAAVGEKTPLAAGQIARDASRAVAEIETATAKAVARTGAAGGPLAAGDKLQEGLNSYVNAFKGRAGVLFDNVEKLIPKGTPVRLDRTAATVAEAKQYFAAQPELAAKLGLTKWDAVVDEAAANGTNWQAVRQFRTSIGEAIGSNRGALADEDLGRLKSLYGALTEDMTAAAKAAGPKAYAEWQNANRFYAKGADRIERYLDQTISAKSPERAFETFVAMTKGDRVSSDVTRMRKIKASMPVDDWNAVAATIVDRLGKSPSGQQGAMGDTFSPGVFLTEWNKMSQEAKAILLPGDVRNELEQIARVSERVKASNSERNMSNTGMITQAGIVGAGLANQPVATVSLLAASNLSARALTSQTFLRAVNDWNAGRTKGLSAMATGSGPFASDAVQILRLMAAEAANSPEQPKAMAQ